MSFRDKWPETTPSIAEGDKKVPQFNQYLYEYWKRTEGPCNNCPNHFLKENCYPAFGKGSAGADLMLVGNVPGSRDKSGLETDYDRRVDPAKLEEYPEFNGVPLAAFHDESLSDLYDWGQAFGTLRNNFIEGEKGLDSNLEEVYFTNAKKCVDIVGQDNAEAREKCRDYFSEEIKIVNPEILITFGLNPAETAAICLDYDPSNLPSAMSLPEGDVQPTNSFIGYRETTPPLITMPHWSGLRGDNPESIPGFDPTAFDSPIKQIYYELARLVEHL